MFSCLSSQNIYIIDSFIGLNIFYFNEIGSSKAKLRHEPYPLFHFNTDASQTLSFSLVVL